MKPLKHRGALNRRWRKILKLILVDHVRVTRWSAGLSQITPAQMCPTRDIAWVVGASVCDEMGQGALKPPREVPLFPMPFLVRQALCRQGRLTADLEWL